MSGCLPSGDSASRLVGGDVGALPAVAFHTLLRAALAGVGLYVAGVRQNLVRYSIAGALGIEAGVLVWAVKNRPTRVQQPTETALEHAG